MPKGQRTSLQSIERKIAQLQAEADALKSKDRNTVIQRINEAIRHYGIEAGDLIFAARRRGRTAAAKFVRKPLKRAGRPPTVRFRDGANIRAGRGKRPTWLNEKLAAGVRLENFLVK